MVLYFRYCTIWFCMAFIFLFTCKSVYWFMSQLILSQRAAYNFS